MRLTLDDADVDVNVEEKSSLLDFKESNKADETHSFSRQQFRKSENNRERITTTSTTSPNSKNSCSTRWSSCTQFIFTLLLAVGAFVVGRHSTTTSTASDSFALTNTNAHNSSVLDLKALNVQDEGSIEHAADGIERVLFYKGCSGSSATFRVSEQILAAHGFNLWKGKKELNKPKKHPYYEKAKQKLQSDSSAKELNKDDIMLEAFRLLNDAVTKNNKTLFFSAYYDDGRYLDRLDNPLFTGMERRNKLDQLLCEIKDCFVNQKFGFTVFADNGTKTDNLCFQRRRYDVKLKVHLDTNRLVDRLLTEIEKEKNQLDATKALISNVQYYEDLFAFEYTSNNTVFEESMNAWYLLMTPLINVDTDILKNATLPIKNSRPPPSLHAESIENFLEVKKALESAEPPLDYFLRL